MKLKTALLTALMTLLTLTQASALSVLVNGSPLQSDVPPQIINNRTFVPVSAVADATGAAVNWEAATKTVVVQKEGKEIRIQIGAMAAMKNGETIALDAPAQIVSGRTLVPLSFIAANLDIPVAFDASTKTVLIGEQILPQPVQNSYKVLRVIDGDTIEIDMNGVKEKVRLIGVDTPESVHPNPERNVPFGKIASGFTKTSLEGKMVTLEQDVSPRDKYGRILAYVWLDGQMFNRTLIENGMARAKSYVPDVKYADEFAQLQEAARIANRGIWENYDSIFPSTQESQAIQPAQPSTTQTVTTDAAKEGVWIKGNRRSKIYHVPTGRDYYKISPKNIVWFRTAAEAEAAGYRAAKQ